MVLRALSRQSLLGMAWVQCLLAAGKKVLTSRSYETPAPQKQDHPHQEISQVPRNGITRGLKHVMEAEPLMVNEPFH